MNKDIGNKIKFLRQSKGMTLKTLSEQVGLSIGFFSQLERGLTSIAVDSLGKIAEVLGVELSYFLQNTTEKPDIVIKSYEQQITEIVNSNIIYYNLSNKTSSSDILPRLVHILPHEGKEKVIEFSHDGEEFIYVLEGILTVFVDNQEYNLYPGDCVHFDSILNHNWINNTNMNVKLLLINTPNFLKKKHADK